MKKEIIIGDQKIFYNLRRSQQAKNMRLTIYYDGELTATLPNFLDESLLDKFIREKSSWIFKRLERARLFEGDRNSILRRHSRKEYIQNKKQALNFVKEKLEYFNQFYNFYFERIAIRNQKTRWGSCSRKGNLNFNYKVIFLPEKLADYIVVHELCHLKEFNHSKNFWNLVAKTVPNHREAVREIRKL